MPKYRIDIPGQGSFEVDSPSALNDQQAYQSVLGQIEADKARAIEKEKASGAIAGFKSGIEGLKGAYYGGKYGLFGDEADRQKLLESQAKQEKLYQGPGWEETKQAFSEQGVLPGLRTALSAATGTLGQSIPYMAAPVAAAALAPEAAIAGVGLGTLGFLGTSAAQYTGQNVGRQVQEQEAAIKRGETPQELSMARAAAASVPAALLDRFALGQTFKGTGLGKLFGQEGKEAVEQVANKIMKSGGDPSKIGAILTGGARGIASEIPNEVGQQILERAQAGLSLTNDDAMREYKEAAFGATLLGGPFGGVSGASIRGAGVKQAGEAIEGARAEMGKDLQQRQLYQADMEAQNLAQEQPQLPGMEAPLVGPTGIRPEEIAPEAPAFELAPQGIQGELGLEVPEQPVAPEVTTAPIDTTFLKDVGLAGAIGLKAKGKHSIVGMDLNDPQQAATVRENLVKVGETTKSGKVAAAIEELLRTDTRLQVQPEMAGFPTQPQLDQLQVEKDTADAEVARQARNTQLNQLLADLEGENAAKEEASQIAARRAAEQQRAALAKGVTEDITQVPFTGQLAPAQVPPIEAAVQPTPEVTTPAIQSTPEVAVPSTSVPSEVGAESTAGGLEPSVAVYDQSGGRGAAAGVEPSGEPLGLAERNVEGAVETPREVGGALTQGDINRITAALRKEGLTREEAQQQVTEATPEELIDLQRLYAPVQAAAKTTAEQEADIAEAAQTEGEFGDISARQIAAPIPTVGMDKVATQGIVDRLKQGWKRDVNVVVKNFDEETPGRQAAMQAKGLDTAKGYIDHDGTVVILANNNANEADVAATLFHESLGHLGLRLKFREELTNLMEKFYHTNADLKRAANKWLLDHKGEYDEKMPVNEKYAKAVEEVLAERAEAGRLPAGIMDKIKAFINKWARKAGLNIAYSDAEVRSILDQAQKEVTEKTGEAKTAPAPLAPRAATTTAEELFNQAGGDIQAINRIEPTRLSKHAQTMREAAVNPKAALKNWLDTFETMTFSSDAALQNEFRRSFTEQLNGTDATAQDAINQLLAASTSQALHDEAVGQGVVEMGGAEYDNELHKWVVKDLPDSWQKLVELTHSIGQKYGVDPDTIIAYAHTYLEANRLNGLRKLNNNIEATAEKLDSKGKKHAADKLRDTKKYIHKEDAQIDAGLKLKDQFPEFQQVVDMWNGVRKNVMDIATKGELYTKEDAQELLDIIDYVPFQRIMDQEEETGLRMFGRGLLIPAKEYAMTGSDRVVNNIFDNMEKWVNYTVRRAVRNKSALNLVDLMQSQWDGAKEVPKAIKGREANTIALFKDGVRTFYDLDDPKFVLAFRGLDSMALPSIKYFSAAANFVRQNIVLNPLFSISQLPQDAFAAMLSSGLKHPWKLPLEVMKEFWKTLRGTSEAHKILKSVGAVGRRDVTAATSRMDAEIAAGLRKPTTWQRLIDPLHKFSMASDNAVRQAIYNQTVAEGGTPALAAERAFEIINFRRRGASGKLAVVGQVIPFFNAYLQAQNVAIKVLSGRGIAPSTRKEAHKILLRNSLIISAMTMLYASLMSDDDDYKGMDVNIRDKHWVLPGGLMIPMRTDLFSLPKILGEHAYSLITDQSYDDPVKARKAISDAVKNALLSPTVVPQGAKPLFEVIINKDIYRDRPIIGRGIENRETKEQYTASTSELAKLIGSTGLIAPVNVDHLLRGYLGTTGGLGMMATNAAIEPFTGVPRAEKTGQDFIAAIPGLSTFIAKEFGAGDKNDFYELKKDVDKVVGTMNYYKNNRMVDDLREYVADTDNKKLLALAPALNHIQTQLAALRKRELQITNAPESQMSGEQKGVAIRQIREAEQRLMVNVHKYRVKAYD